MKVRRVVTGHTRDGKATVASVTEVEAITAALLRGAEFHRLWGADEVPTFPDDGALPSAPAYFPPIGGFRFISFTAPPQSVTLPEDLDLQAGLLEMEEKLPGLAAYMEADHPGMHTTNTIDFIYVISGEVWLELGDGEEVHLQAGNTVVQNGTRHAWHNRGSKPCRMVGFLVGANRKG